MSSKWQKRCKYCGRYFRPDKRVKGQKSCFRKPCKSKRKKESQEAWLKKNPDYFKGRYEQTKEFREKNPTYQSEWRAKRREIQDEIPSSGPIKTIRIVVPEKILKCEIQDEFRLVKQCGCGFFVTGPGVRDTRRDRLKPPDF